MSLKTTLFKCDADSIWGTLALAPWWPTIARVSHLADVAHQPLRRCVHGVEDHELRNARTSRSQNSGGVALPLEGSR